MDGPMLAFPARLGTCRFRLLVAKTLNRKPLCFALRLDSNIVCTELLKGQHSIWLVALTDLAGSAKLLMCCSWHVDVEIFVCA